MNRFFHIFLMALLLYSADAMAQTADSAVVSIDSLLSDVSGEYQEKHYNESSRPRDTQIVRKVPAAVVDSFQNDKAFAYANDPEYWAQKPVSQPWSLNGFFRKFFANSITRIVAYSLIALALALLIYRLIKANSLFYLSSRKRKAVLDDADLAEIADDQLDKKINAAVAAGEFNKAVRYHFFQTLQLLDRQGIIRFHAQATNQDYLRQVNQHPPLARFRYLTTVYEYVWYGGFSLNADRYRQVNDAFVQFNTAVKQ